MLHCDTLIKTDEDGIIPVNHLFIGHHISTPEGVRMVTNISRHKRFSTRIVFTFDTQTRVVFEKTQCFFIRENILELGTKLRVGDKIMCKSGMRPILKISWQRSLNAVWMVGVNSLQNKFYLANGVLVGQQNVRRRNS